MDQKRLFCCCWCDGDGGGREEEEGKENEQKMKKEQSIPAEPGKNVRKKKKLSEESI
jgi:hypothetical protein